MDRQQIQARLAGYDMVSGKQLTCLFHLSVVTMCHVDRQQTQAQLAGYDMVSDKQLTCLFHFWVVPMCHCGQTTDTGSVSWLRYG